MKGMIKHFDIFEYLEEFLKDHLPSVKKVLSTMKDENCGKVLLEFAGLRSKMYAAQCIDH